ncbi:MAG: ABC transporter substrate-binding protein [Deltaproteobacteria bacterium]|nr:ABC transporter substrate-binding protein [Deltaproteobacteria bacterium]
MRISALFTGLLVLPALAVAEPVNVGAILPLSGDMASWGVNVRRGVDLAAKNDPNIVTLYEDEGFCNTARALNAANDLVARRGTRFLVTGCLNGTKVITPLATREKLLILSGGLLSGEEKQPDVSSLLSLSGQIASEGAELAKLVAQKGHSKVAFVRYDDEFTSAVYHSLTRSLIEQRAKGVVLDFPIASDFMDFSSVLTRVRQQGADALLVYVGEKQLLTLIKRRNELGLKLVTYSGYVIESNGFTDADRKLLEGIVYAYPELAAPEDPARIDFERKYQAEYGATERPNSNTYFVYDGINIFRKALEYCAEKSPKCVRDYFLTKGPFRGASGDFSYTESGFVNRRFVVKTIRNGAFVPLFPAT